MQFSVFMELYGKCMTNIFGQHGSQERYAEIGLFLSDPSFYLDLFLAKFFTWL